MLWHGCVRLRNPFGFHQQENQGEKEVLQLARCWSFPITLNTQCVPELHVSSLYVRGDLQHAPVYPTQSARMG